MSCILVNIGSGNGLLHVRCQPKPMLTHWGRDKMDAISQTTFSHAFSSMKIVVFWLNFHWNMFPRIQLTIIQHWFRKWLGADQAASHYLNQWWLIHRRIYATLGLNELTYCQLDTLGTSFTQIKIIKIKPFNFEKFQFNMSAKCHSFFFGFIVFFCGNWYAENICIHHMQS